MRRYGARRSVFTDICSVCEGPGWYQDRCRWPNISCFFLDNHFFMVTVSSFFTRPIWTYTPKEGEFVDNTRFFFVILAFRDSLAKGMRRQAGPRL